MRAGQKTIHSRGGEEVLASEAYKLLPTSGKDVFRVVEAKTLEMTMTLCYPAATSTSPIESAPLQKTFVREVTVVYRGSHRSTSAIRGPESAANFIRTVLPDNSREHFVVLHLDGSHRVIGYAVVATGSANACPVHPREVFQGAILIGAVALILSHNHPSGMTTPSLEDQSLTNRLKEGGTLLGVTILDHIIVTDTSFHSLKESGVVQLP